MRRLPNGLKACRTISDLKRSGFEIDGESIHGATYQGGYFGESGKDLGDVEIEIFPVRRDAGTYRNTSPIVAYMVADISSPGAIEEIWGYAVSLMEAQELAEKKAAELDESENDDD